MPVVDLNDTEWQQLMNVLATTREHPWTVTNPLLMKIGGQLNAQARAPLNQAVPPGGGVRMEGIKLDANGKEVRDE